MSKKPVLYQEKVKMPDVTMGVNCFYLTNLYSPTNELFPKHWHDCLEIIYIEKGQLNIKIDLEDAVSYTAGDIVVINPCSIHECSYFLKDSKLYCILLDLNLLRSRFLESVDENYIVPVMENKIFFKNKIEDDKKLSDIIVDVYDLFTKQDTAYQLIVRSRLTEILYILIKNYTISSYQEKQSLLTLDRERINLILRYIDEHYMDKLTLDSIVEILHINKYYVCKIFKRATGKTFLNYLNIVRNEKALELLVTTNLSITEIAQKTGFHDMNYFSRTFKQLNGTVPTKIRKKLKEDIN